MKRMTALYAGLGAFLRRRAAWLLPAVVLLVLAGVTLAQSGGVYDLSWWTVDSGGGTSSGGPYTVSGTAGQADAGVLSGGAYVVQGGFWGGADWSQGMSLVPGWNLISLPLAPVNTAVTQALSSIAGKYDLVYAYDAFSATPWKKYNTSAPPFLNTLTQVYETQGLWVRVTALTPVSLTVTGTFDIAPTIPLKAGWNLVGYPSQTTRPVTVALASIDTQYDLVYAYYAWEAVNPWKKYNTTAPPFLNTLKEMAPGLGYWVRAKVDCTWVVP